MALTNAGQKCWITSPDSAPSGIGIIQGHVRPDGEVAPAYECWFYRTLYEWEDGGAFGIQLAISRNNHSLWIRDRNNGVYSSWERIDAGRINLSGYATENWVSTNFQAGVDTIYNSVVNAGVTPASSTPSDVSAAISKLGELASMLIGPGIIQGYSTFRLRFDTAWYTNVFAVCGCPPQGNVDVRSWYPNVNIGSYRFAKDNEWAVKPAEHSEPGSTLGLVVEGRMSGAMYYATDNRSGYMVAVSQFSNSGNFYVHTGIIVSPIFSESKVLAIWRS